jgi:hypothetical protein
MKQRRLAKAIALLFDCDKRLTRVGRSKRSRAIGEGCENRFIAAITA